MSWTESPWEGLDEHGHEHQNDGEITLLHCALVVPSILRMDLRLRLLLLVARGLVVGGVHEDDAAQPAPSGT